MKKLINMWQTADQNTQGRTITFFVTWVLSIYALILNISHSGFNIDTVQYLVVTILAGVMSIRTWWKNNSFTKAAVQADELMNAIKNENTEDETETKKETDDSEQ